MIIATVLILIAVTVILMISVNNNSRKKISNDVSANGNPSGVDGGVGQVSTYSAVGLPSLGYITFSYV